MPPSSARFAYLDGVRALAILAVLAIHWGGGRTTLGRGGFIGVDVFFVLSGFVITTVLWRSTTLPALSPGAAWISFTRARVRRLYPAVLGLVALGTPLMLLPGSPVEAGDTLRHAAATLFQVTWVVELSGTVAEPFRQTWSLGIEWLFYLTWPLVVLAWRRRDADPRRAALQTALVGGALFVGCTLVLQAELYYFNPLTRFGQILLGGALALALAAAPPVPRRHPAYTAACLVGLGALGAYVLVGPTPDGAAGRLVGGPLATVVALALVHHAYAVSGGAVHGLLGHRWLAGLGRVSYSLYLWHWIPLYLLDDDKLGLPMPVVAAMGIAMVAVLTAASYVLLERPFVSSRGAALAPRQDPAASVGVPSA